MTKFETVLEKFVDGCQNIYDKYHGTPDNDVGFPIISIEGGVKFKRINIEYYGQVSVYCFVAMVDGCNKKLGNWLEGDIFKADGYKGPARGTRGNIFNSDNGLGRIGPFGPEYNK